MRPDFGHWRKWSWFLIVWTGGALVLSLLSLAFFGDGCQAMEGVGLTVCRAGSAAGALVFLFLIYWVWLIGFMFLMLGWFARRPPVRLCPPYGHPVAPGRTDCRKCGYDFLTGKLPSDS